MRARIFCREYIKCKFNGSEAARNAGYTGEDKVIGIQACRMLADARVKKKIAELMKDQLNCLDLTGERILSRIKEMADAAYANGDIAIAIHGYEVLGRGTIFSNSGRGVKTIQSNPDGTMRIMFNDDLDVPPCESK
jgi:phage terminase small subunit